MKIIQKFENYPGFFANSNPLMSSLAQSRLSDTYHLIKFHSIQFNLTIFKCIQFPKDFFLRRRFPQDDQISF